jgi:hypothetical protein
LDSTRLFFFSPEKKAKYPITRKTNITIPRTPLLFVIGIILDSSEELKTKKQVFLFGISIDFEKLMKR